MALQIRTKIVFIATAILIVAIGINAFFNVSVSTGEHTKALQSEAFIHGQTLKAQLNRLLRLRIPLEDLSLSVQAMIISIKTGANLPIALKKIADTIQQRNLFYKKLSAITAQGRTQGIMVGLLPFAIGFLLYLNDHSFIEVLFKTFIGNCVIGA